MMTKYATFEGASVLELKSSPDKVKTASLSRMADFHDYRTEDGYLYARIRAISSRVNKNHDGWPSIELAGGGEDWDQIQSQHQSSEGTITVESSKDKKFGFSTFTGRPIFVDHNNSNPNRTRGAIVDSKLRILDQKTAAEDDDYWGGRNGSVDDEHMPPTEVELLLEIDAKSFPKFAKAIIDGDLDGFSMGCDVEYSKCSHCGHEASTPDEYCSHIKMKGAEHDFKLADGTKTSRKSYENCYGINFFEISGVFDPADETALAKEVRSEHSSKTADVDNEQFLEIPCPHCGERGRLHDVGNGTAYCVNCGHAENLPDFSGQVSGGDGAHSEIIPRNKYMTPPAELPLGGIGVTPRYQGSYLASKIAEAPEPQSFHTIAPQEVDTLREEKICPICGSDMDSERCDVCGYDEPPEHLQNPDLTKAQDLDLTNQDQDELTIPANEDIPPPADGEGQSYLDARNKATTANVNSDMRWEPKEITLTASGPQGDEPETETVTSDQDTPVTAAFRTAKDMIQAAKRNQNKENNMSDQTKVAADPADPSGKAKTQVDVTGVGGVDEASAEAASKADAQTDVTGKGGIIEDSNQAASSPDSTQSVEQTSDNAGFQPGGQVGPDTQTFPNTNEPDSAVTDKAFPTSANHGVQPVDPVGKAQDRIDVEQPPHDQVGDRTQTWTGTDGNGVLRQQDPVTNVPTQSGGVTSGLISLAALKLAETEVELGIISNKDKFNRLAELEDLTDEEIAAEQRALSKVKTAGLSRTASNGGVAGRLPSFSRIASDEPTPAQPVDDALVDSAIFS